jgi:hypothetical protein
MEPDILVVGAGPGGASKAWHGKATVCWEKYFLLPIRAFTGRCTVQHSPRRCALCQRSVELLSRLLSGIARYISPQHPHAPGAPRPMAGESYHRSPGASPRVGGHCGWCYGQFYNAEGYAFLAFAAQVC